MTIRIVTDSTCDLPVETIARYQIHVVPMYINIGDRGYLDGIDITREEFYNRLPYFSNHPSTAIPSMERFAAAYTALNDEGAEHILSIHISSALSGVVDIARVAAKESRCVPITVFDSRQLSLGTGYLVEKAAQMAAIGASITEIIQSLQDQIRRTHVFAALDTLEFIKRSGRMNKYMVSLASLLKIIPIMTMFDGNPGSERVLTRERALKRVIDMLDSMSPIEKVSIVHTHVPNQIFSEFREMAAHLLPNGNILSADITPVIGAHIGPGAIGFAVVQTVNQPVR